MYYSKSEIAKKLGVSNRTVDNWMASGKISFTKVGRRIIFSDHDLEQLIANNRREAFYYEEQSYPVTRDFNSGGILNSAPTSCNPPYYKHVKNQ